MAEMEIREGYHLERPNREKSSSKGMKAVIILLLLVSVGLMLIVTIGGWGTLAGAKVVQVFYMIVYLVMAFFIARWSRGVLPLAAALAIVLGIFAGIAGPEWFSRDKEGFTDPALDESILGLITLIIAPVQILLIGACLRGFQQEWNVEVEVPDGQSYHPGMFEDEPGGRPAPA